MSLYPIPETPPRIRRTLVNFMSTEEFEELKNAPRTNPLKDAK